MSIDLPALLRLFGVTSIVLPLTCASVGCQGNGDGGAFTINDFLDAADRHEVEYNLDVELDRPGEAYLKQAAGVDSGFRAKGSIKGHGDRRNIGLPSFKNETADNATEGTNG